MTNGPEKRMFTAHTPVKRVCAIHDLSAFGRCALTVVIPTLSAMGIQTVPCPTAVMSTHTGGFSDIHIVDLTQEMRPMAAHWFSLGVTFDAVYSGFVLDAAQGEIIADLIDRAKEKKPDTLVLVDPVMGDDGVLYSTCTPEMIGMMRTLCRRADVITPNLTEACMLCGVSYIGERSVAEAELAPLCRSLFPSLLSWAKRAAITGIPVEKDGMEFVCTAVMERGDSEAHPILLPRVGAGYPGTGELFASVLLGRLLGGMPFCEAARSASAFTCDVITFSSRADTPTREGVLLEPCLPHLWEDA